MTKLQSSRTRDKLDMMVPRELQGVLVCTPDTLSGAVRFAGTRVPVQALLDTFEDGEGISEFLEGWPDVTREQAEAVIRWQLNRARATFAVDRVTG